MPNLLSVDNALLLVIDIQEKFKPILFNADAVVEATRRMICACNQLDVPVLVTEQYPRGLGHTVEPLVQALPPHSSVLEKTSFGCCGDAAFMDALAKTGRRQILVCGLEAHICVNQTVCELLSQGYEVFLIEDAIGTRFEANYHIAMRKLAQAGAIPSCVEMALFQLMRVSTHPQFKAVQQIIL